MNLNYKLRFNQSEYAKPFNQALDTPWFEQAIFTALLQMQANLTANSDMQTAAANDWKMKGARQFVDILINLTTNPLPPRNPVDQNLDHATASNLCLKQPQPQLR